MQCVLCCAAMCRLEAAGKSLSATVLWGEKIIIMIILCSAYLYDNALLPWWPNEIPQSQSSCYKARSVGIWMYICALVIFDMSGDYGEEFFRSLCDWNLQSVEGKRRSWEVGQGKICWETPKKIPFIFDVPPIIQIQSWLSHCTLTHTARFLMHSLPLLRRLISCRLWIFHLLTGRDESKNKSPVSD